jgi:UDP-glucose 4-epimerase
LEALQNGQQPKVFGDDYDTPDGSCIRDYVHVQDLAQAHVAAMQFVENSNATFMPINIGTGKGSSVFEVINKISDVTGIDIEPLHVDKREGDPAALVADVSRAHEILEWSSSCTLDDIIQTAWDAWQKSH